MKIQAALVFICFVVNPLIASTDISKLERQLTETQGRERAAILAQLADLTRNTNPEKSLEFGQASLDLLKKTPGTDTEVQALNAMAWSHLKLGEFKLSETLVSSSMELAKENKNTLGLAAGLNTLGSFYWYKGDLTSAKTHLKQSLALYRQENVHADIARLLSNVGTIEQYAGNYSVAMELFKESLHHAELVDNKGQQAATLNNIGVLNHETKQLSKALKYYQQSLDLKLEIKSWAEAVESYNNVAGILADLDKLDLSLEYFNKGFKLLKQVESPYAEMHLYLNRGNLQRRLLQFDAALSDLSQAERLAGEREDLHVQRVVQQYMAQTYLDMGTPKAALPYSREALLIASEHNLDKIDEAYYNLYQIQKELNNYSEALKSHESYSESKDRRLENERINHMNTLQEEYETSKKEERILFLEEKNAYQIKVFSVGSVAAIILLIILYLVRSYHLKTIYLEKKVAQRTNEISRHNDTISTLLKEKESLLDKKNQLFANVSHEFRTPLTLILGPIKKLRKDLRISSEYKALDCVIFNAGRLLRMVDQLLDIARIDMMSEEKSEPVNISQVAEETLVNMESLAVDRNLTLRSNLIDDLWIEISQEALEKILANLLSNAIKYTPSGGVIEIKSRAHENNKKHPQVCLEVRDNGIGIPDDQSDVIFERFVERSRFAAK